MAGVAVEFGNYAAGKCWAIEEVQGGPADGAAIVRGAGRRQAQGKEAGIERIQPADGGAVGDAGVPGERLLVENFAALFAGVGEEEKKTIKVVRADEFPDVVFDSVGV